MHSLSSSMYPSRPGDTPNTKPKSLSSDRRGAHLAEESTGLGTQSQSHAAPALQPGSDGGGVAASTIPRKSHQDMASAFLNHELPADGWAGQTHFLQR